MRDNLDIYKDLINEPDIIHSVCKFIANSESGIYYDFGYSIIKKGTKLYRIRTYREKTDYSNINEWCPAPLKPQNRCNMKGETAIYLSSNEDVCILETHIPPGSKYVLGEYTVTQDIKVGGFNYVMPCESDWKLIAAMIFNAFLIAPVRNERNNRLFELLDTYFVNDKIEMLKYRDVLTKDNIVLPFRLGHIYPSKNYFDFTNRLCNVLKSIAPYGIRYSSCYIPVETVGIESSHYNVVIYKAALNSIRFYKYEVKENHLIVTPEGIFNTLRNSIGRAEYI